MAEDKLSVTIEKEKANLEKLKKQRAEIDAKIKKSEAKIEEYEVVYNSQKYDELSAMVKKKGLSIEDVLGALQSGDLAGLQKQMESAANNNDMSDEEA